MRRCERCGRCEGRGRCERRVGERAGGDRGYVTAEAAVAVPSLVLVLGMLLWGVMASAALIQCVDAARVGARAAARGEPHELTVRAARSAGPDGARVTVRREGDLVRVEVRARTAGPGPLTLPLRGEAVAWAEGR